jgi:hypothetical protein
MKNGLILIKPTSVVASPLTGVGLNPNGSVTFASLTGVSLNGVFSDNYENYMIVLRYKNTSGDSPLNFALRAAGTDQSSGGNYNIQQLTSSLTTVTGSRSTSQNVAPFAASSATLYSGTFAYIYGPFLPQPTVCRSASISGQSNATLVDYSWTHGLSTSYDGFTISGGFDAFGQICVYGMRD